MDTTTKLKISSGDPTSKTAQPSEASIADIFKTQKQAAMTTQLTTVTHEAIGTADYAIADLTATGPYGFVAKDEGTTVLSVIANLQVRVAELETALKAIGLLA